MSFLLNLYAQSRYKACIKTYQHCYKSYPQKKGCRSILSLFTQLSHYARDLDLPFAFGFEPPNDFLRSPVSRGGKPVC